MDLLPTFARLAGAKLPTHKIDGKNIWPLWNQSKAKTPHESFYYYQTQHLEAIRDARWKLYLPHSPDKPVRKGTKRRQQPMLYEVKTDIAEKHDVAAQHPEIVKRLTQSAQAARRDLGEGKQKGANTRPVGKFKKPTARVK
jgi:arylsulfatase A-like enzyme